VLLSEFSEYDRTAFEECIVSFLLSLGIRRMHNFISFFFGKKKRKKVTNKKESLNYSQNIRLNKICN